MTESPQTAPRRLTPRNLLRGAVVGRYSVLLLAVVLLGGLYPVLRYGLWGNVVWTTSFWLVLLGCVHAMRPSRSVAVIPPVAAFIHVGSELVFILKSARLLPRSFGVCQVSLARNWPTRDGAASNDTERAS